MTPALAPAIELPGSRALPLYERVRAALADRIRAGEWAPGEALPPELALAKAYGVALGTFRRAVSALVDDGLLERRQGSGTFLRHAGAFSSSMFRFFRLQGGDGRDLRPEARLLVREVGDAPADVRAALGVGARAQLIRMSRLRLGDGEPVLAEEIVLPFQPFRAFLRLPADAVGPLLYPVYAEACGIVIARAEETITFGPCPAVPARLLRKRAGSPAVAIERVAYGLDGRPKEWRRSWGPAELFHYRVEIR